MSVAFTFALMPLANYERSSSPHQPSYDLISKRYWTIQPWVAASLSEEKLWIPTVKKRTGNLSNIYFPRSCGNSETLKKRSCWKQWWFTSQMDKVLKKEGSCYLTLKASPLRQTVTPMSYSNFYFPYQWLNFSFYLGNKMINFTIVAVLLKQDTVFLFGTCSFPV